MDPQPGTPVPTPAANPPHRQTVQLPEGPLRVVVEHPRGFWGRMGTRFMWVALVVMLVVIFNQQAMYREYFKQPEDEISEKYHSLSKTASNKIAIIEVDGAIMSGEGFAKQQIDRVREDKDVVAVVLRVNSPGGTVTGSDYIYHHLKELLEEKKIPMVVSMGSLAASGGYYVSMAVGDGEKRIYAEPTTWTGSIGVIIPHYDVSGLLEKWNVTDDSIASGSMKQMLSPTRHLDEAEREKEQAVVQNLVNECFADFKELVLKSRAALRNDQALQDTVFTGQIFTAKQAKEYGLIDEFGFIEDAIGRAAELAHLSTDNVRVVKYKQPSTLSELFGASAAVRGSAQMDVARLLDLTAPRAYFLCTWLPSVMQ